MSSIADVFPCPRHVTWERGEGSLAETAVRHTRTLPAQGYELVIKPGGTSIRHADDLGLRYARHTLRQLGRSEVVPTGRIVDWPDFPHRGLLLDISRDRVPTMATLEWLVTRLARLRYNHLQLYVEHTFAYEGHETVWSAASPVTPAELQALDRLCRRHGIELSACQNTFGHMDRWLCHGAYRHRAECPDGSPHPLKPSGTLPPWCLEPTPENAQFALELVRELAENLTSRRVNIGADEPFDLGLGRSKARVQERGRSQVFVEHLRRLTDPLIDEGFEVQFWGDALTRHPEMVPGLPSSGATALVWRYEAPAPDGPSLAALAGPELADAFGIPEKDHLGFCTYAAPYVDAGFPLWVAPGTSSWNSLVGRWTNARGNLLDAANVGHRAGAQGYLVTDWGDNGHHQPLPVSTPAMVYGAGLAWCRSSNQDIEVGPLVEDLLDADEGVGARLAELGDLYAKLGVSARNGSPLLYALANPHGWPLHGALSTAAAEDAEVAIDQALAHFATVPFTGERRSAIAAELVAACRLARQGLWRLRQLHGNHDVDPARQEADLAEVVSLYREAWLATSRPGGLSDSVAKLAGS